jgi:hypothetical protein
MSGAPRVTAQGQRVSYDWDDRPTERYVNDVTGLEHGFTVASRPAGATGELVLSLAVRGGLRPVVEGGDGASSTNEASRWSMTWD